jgi:hypothetical protein
MKMALFDEDIQGKKSKLQDLSTRLQKDYNLNQSGVKNLIESAISNSNGGHQVVINITGYSKSKNALSAHSSYLTSQTNRDNKIKEDTFKTISGNDISKDNINKKTKAWYELDGGDKGNSRIALKMVLSSPSGSNPRSVEKAVIRFSEKEFGKTNDYFHVLHTDTNNPHVHLVVRMRGYDGKKLDPRKSDLKKWRDAYGKELNKENINVISTTRASRGIGVKSDKLVVDHMRKKYSKDMSLPKSKRKGVERPKIDTYIENRALDKSLESNSFTDDYENVKNKMLDTNNHIRDAYDLIGDFMIESNDSKLVEQGAKIKSFAKSMPVPKTRLELEKEKVSDKIAGHEK